MTSWLSETSFFSSSERIQIEFNHEILQQSKPNNDALTMWKISLLALNARPRCARPLQAQTACKTWNFIPKNALKLMSTRWMLSRNRGGWSWLLWLCSTTAVCVTPPPLPWASTNLSMWQSHLVPCKASFDSAAGESLIGLGFGLKCLCRKYIHKV